MVSINNCPWEITGAVLRVQGKDLSQLIVPALDRGLYSWAGDKLSQLPFTANHLVDNPQFQKGRGTFLIGSKTNDVVGINLQNGQVRNENMLARHVYVHTQVHVQAQVHVHTHVHIFLQAVYECSPQRCHRYDNQSMISCMDRLMMTLSRGMAIEANDRTGEEL